MIKINKIEPVTFKAYDPNGNCLGYLNEYEFNDLRIQICKEGASGYYMIFVDRRIEIRPDGTLDGWPNGFYDLHEIQLSELIYLRGPKTSQEWQLRYPNPKVLDPDGWDRENFQHSWYEERISYAEYQKRLFISTCMFQQQ